MNAAYRRIRNSSRANSSPSARLARVWHDSTSEGCGAPIDARHQLIRKRRSPGSGAVAIVGVGAALNLSRRCRDPRAFEMSASGSPWLCRLLTPRRTSQVFAASSAPAEKAETPHALSHRVACNDSVRSIVALCRDASPTGRSPECATISPKHRPIRRLPRRQTAFISAQRVISPSSVRRGALVVVLEPNIGGGRCASC